MKGRELSLVLRAAPTAQSSTLLHADVSNLPGAAVWPQVRWVQSIAL